MLNTYDIILTACAVIGARALVLIYRDTVRIRKQNNLIEERNKQLKKLSDKINNRIDKAFELVNFIQSNINKHGYVDRAYLEYLQEEEDNISQLMSDFHRLAHQPLDHHPTK